ncbi:LOW QUALITY PROTEIN: hypothetical protein V1477_017830 [Vespula maculifrons]|uniref:Ribosomal protein S3 n=1 Tax=Vespula maculifrons TaxID=7453 RepID=A0ABD2AZH5_VESMC
MEKKHFSLTIFFSETIAPRRTGVGTQENRSGVIGKDSSRPLRPYFFLPDWTNRSRVITEPSYNGLKVTKEKKHFSLTIFFSETIAPRRTGLGSLERARRALYAHIFFLQIGPIGADTEENRTGVIGKESSRPLRPYFFRPDRTNRSRVITEPSYNGLKVTKEKKHFSLTIFFSETIAPRRTGLGSLERARRALYAHIFFVQIEPIGAKTQENRSGVIGKDSSRPLRPYFFRPDRTNRSQVITVTKEKKHFSLTIFFSETIGPRRTGPGSLERTRRALYSHIFFFQIGPIGADTQENRCGVIGKGSSRPVRPYFFRPDRINRSRVITENLTGVIGKGSSRPVRPYFFRPDRINRSRVITENLTGVIGKGSSRPLRPYFFRPDRTNRSRVITQRREPDRGHSKGLVAPSAPIFFHPNRTNRSRVITHPGEPDQGHWKGPVASSTPHLGEPVRGHWKGLAAPYWTNRSRVITEPSYNGLKVTKEKKHFSLTIFFSETIGPRRTGPGSLERTRRALYAHIFFVQIGPIGAKTQENRSGVIGKDSSRPLRPYFFLPDRTNRSRVITENLTGVIGKGSSRPLRPYFFRPDRTNRSRVITHRREPDRGHSKGLVAPSAPIFFHPNRTNRSRVITHPGEPDQGHWKGPVASSTPENLSGVIGKGSPRPVRTYFFRPDRTNRSQVITENLTGVIGKDLSRPLRPYFFFPDWTNRSRVITEPSYNGLKVTKEKKHFSLTIFFSETIAPRRTGLGSLERARRALYAHIFFVQIEPIGAKVQRRKTLYLTIFFSETVAPRRT